MHTKQLVLYKSSASNAHALLVNPWHMKTYLNNNRNTFTRMLNVNRKQRHRKEREKKIIKNIKNERNHFWPNWLQGKIKKKKLLFALSTTSCDQSLWLIFLKMHFIYSFVVQFHLWSMLHYYTIYSYKWCNQKITDINMFHGKHNGDLFLRENGHSMLKYLNMFISLLI